MKFFILFFSGTLGVFSQLQVPELQKLSKITLFDTLGTGYQNLMGEWSGEEIQYDETGSFVKFKFKVVLKLKQTGNRIFGTSYIEDKFRGSYGDMKIRGIVTDNKLYFEEYEITNEKFYEKDVVWCLRSGDMDIKLSEGIISLEGLQYNGYASDTYRTCTDHAEMKVNKKADAVIKSSGIEPNSGVAGSKSLKMLIYPNPTRDNITVSYQLIDKSKVKIEVFSLSGQNFETIVGDYLEGIQNQQINLSNYAAGIYLIRLQANGLQTTSRVVKEN